MRAVTRRKKLTYAAGAAGSALLVAGLGAAGAVAASKMLSPSEESKAVIDDAASQLGVEPSALADALKTALQNRIDEAMKAGRLTDVQADALKERIETDDYPLLFGPDGHRGHGGPGFGLHRHLDLLSAAASYLGLSEAELRESFRDKTLAEIAREQGKTVSGLVQALVAAQEKRLDEAVADGRLTEEQASRIRARVRERTEALVNGERPKRSQRPNSRLWPGSGSPRGPPLFSGPPA